VRLRSLLFVPGDRPQWKEKAIHLGAHATIHDLEDLVSTDWQSFSRNSVRAFQMHPDATSAFEGVLFHGMTIVSVGLRAGGAGIASCYTKIGVGTLIAEDKESKNFDEALFSGAAFALRGN
jgi:hypothetical protein